MKLERIELPAQAGGGSRTLVLLHGFGADEHDLLPLARELDPSLRIVSLAAPIALEQGGKAWYRLQEGPQGISFDPREVLEAGKIALEAVEEIAPRFAPHFVLRTLAPPPRSSSPRRVGRELLAVLERV